MSQITDEIRATAEVYTGDAVCQQKSKSLLTDMGLPNGLLPLKDIVEAGHVEETGFVWLIQKEKSQHKFEKIGKLVQYAKEVTGFIEKGKIKKLTGVKSKELLIWANLTEIEVNDSSPEKITFRTPAGLFRSFPVDAFRLEEETTVAVAEEVLVK